MKVEAHGLSGLPLFRIMKVVHHGLDAGGLSPYLVPLMQWLLVFPTPHYYMYYFGHIHVQYVQSFHTQRACVHTSNETERSLASRLYM